MYILNKSCECALNSKSIEALYVNDNKLVAMTNGGRPYVINKYKDEETAQMTMEFLISEIKEWYTEKIINLLFDSSEWGRYNNYITILYIR